MEVLEQKQLIEKYRPWIYKMAKKYHFVSSIVDMEDLVSVGEFAVFEARKSYDESKGASENTHIMNFIRGRMLTEVNKNKNYKRSVDNLLIRIKRAQKSLGDEAGSSDIANWITENYPDGTVTENRVKNALTEKEMSFVPLSAIPDNANYIAKYEQDFEVIVRNRDFISKLENNYFNLSDKEILAIKGRLGGETLDVIGNLIGCSKQYASILIIEATKKIKRSLFGININTKVNKPKIPPTTQRVLRPKQTYFRENTSGEIVEDVISYKVGDIVNSGCYEITEVITPGLRYEVKSVSSGKYTVLKHGEII